MAYNKDDLFSKFLSTKPQVQEEKSIKKAPPELRGTTEIKRLSNNKVGRPAKIQEDVKKYSYYLTKRHVDCIKKLALNLDTDFSTIVRDAIEDYARKSKQW